MDEPHPPLRQFNTRLLWAGALALVFLISVLATFRGGYVGPDYDMHIRRLVEWSKVFDFASPDAPAYYLLGHALFRIIGPSTAFPITLSIIQAAINCVALWFFFSYTERRFESPLIHSAFVVFLSFLPVRIIHAATIGTDCGTFPLFVIVLFLFDRFLAEKTSTATNAALLGLVLGLGIFTKYSFMALVPTTLVFFLFVWRNRCWKFQRFVKITASALVIPSVIALNSFWASSRVHGYNTERHWLPQGMPADMNFHDLLSIKANDAQLFRAPEYFKRDILVPHKHGYLALVHMGVFTDPLNLFQVSPAYERFETNLIPDQKTRLPWKTTVMQVSMFLGICWTLLALAGAPVLLLQAIKNLLRDTLEREDVAAILGTAFFLIIFLLLPFVHGGALFGYWTPRLILPALLCFFWAAFLLIDRRIASNAPKIALGIVFLVVVQSATEALMLT